MPVLTASRAALARNWLKVASDTRAARIHFEQMKEPGDRHAIEADRIFTSKKGAYQVRSGLVAPTLHELDHDFEAARDSGHMLIKHTQRAFHILDLAANGFNFKYHFKDWSYQGITALRHTELCSTAFARRLNEKPVLRNRVDARELLQQAANALELVRFVKPEVEVDERARFIKTDPALFYQLVFDGLENARKAVEAKYGFDKDGLDKKRIKIKLSLTQFGEPLVEIDDNGIGVTKEQFTAGKSSWPADMFPEDTGLGAKTIKQNTELLGGEISDVKGKPEGGAILKLKFPPKTRRRAA